MRFSSVQHDTDTDSLLITLGSGWNRCYNIYSKFELAPIETNGKLLNACRVFLPKGDGDIKLNRDWPSDHWAVLAEFELN